VNFNIKVTHFSHLNTVPVNLIIEPILLLWSIIFTFYYTRVRPQCDYSILGRYHTLWMQVISRRVWYQDTCLINADKRISMHIRVYEGISGHTQSHPDASRCIIDVVSTHVNAYQLMWYQHMSMHIKAYQLISKHMSSHISTSTRVSASLANKTPLSTLGTERMYLLASWSF